ncbi:MAG: toll/interleukin-1 receptor domain-containing protein, partial [Bacteroidia bacterium]|nr:toll/interleukin-1 receptor domain-containing protein [Bacteroidia bacterium]
KTVKEYIGKGKLKEAIEVMLTLVADQDANTVLAFQRRLSDLSRKEMLGIIPPSEAMTERNSITHAVLTLCDEIEKKVEVPVPEPEKTKSFAPARIFISFTASDEEHLIKLENQFKPALRNKPVTIWHKGKMPFSEERFQVIEQELNQADIIILLVSADYLAEDEIWQHEFMPAYARLQKKKCVVIPVILSACAWQTTEISGLKVLPEINRAISQMPDTDAAWLTVVKATMDLLSSRQ